MIVGRDNNEYALEIQLLIAKKQCSRNSKISEILRV